MAHALALLQQRIEREEEPRVAVADAGEVDSRIGEREREHLELHIAARELGYQLAREQIGVGAGDEDGEAAVGVEAVDDFLEALTFWISSMNRYLKSASARWDSMAASSWSGVFMER